MIQPSQPDAIDRDKLRKLERKGYRDAYLESQVHAGIAYQFQALRKKFGLSQAEMAERIGKTQSIVSRLESTEYGRVSVQTLLDVACALDVALLVQFVSYPDFLARTHDKSEASMQPETIHESRISIESLAFRNRMAPEIQPSHKSLIGASRTILDVGRTTNQRDTPQRRRTQSALAPGPLSAAAVSEWRTV